MFSCFSRRKMPLLFVCLFGDKLLMSSRGVLSVAVFVTLTAIGFCYGSDF